MCIVCQNKAPINGTADCQYCQNITNDILKVYVKNHTIKKLNCPYTNITEIPHIVGLNDLYCYKTNITEVPHIVELEELNCSYTNITEIPHMYKVIRGLKELYCSSTNITEIPDIEGCYINCNNCYWLEQENIENVITLQKMIRNYYMRKKLIHIRDQLMPIYFHPEMKGGYLHKKSMMADF